MYKRKVIILIIALLVALPGHALCRSVVVYKNSEYLFAVNGDVGHGIRDIVADGEDPNLNPIYGTTFRFNHGEIIHVYASDHPGGDAPYKFKVHKTVSPFNYYYVGRHGIFAYYARILKHRVIFYTVHYPFEGKNPNLKLFEMVLASFVELPQE